MSAEYKLAHCHITCRRNENHRTSFSLMLAGK